VRLSCTVCCAQTLFVAVALSVSLPLVPFVALPLPISLLRALCRSCAFCLASAGLLSPSRFLSRSPPSLTTTSLPGGSIPFSSRCHPPCDNRRCWRSLWLTEREFVRHWRSQRTVHNQQSVRVASVDVRDRRGERVGLCAVFACLFRLLSHRRLRSGSVWIHFPIVRPVPFMLLLARRACLCLRL